MDISKEDIFRLIFNVSQDNFEETALRVFAFQYQHNEIYRQFCNAVNADPAKVRGLKAIPFLPIGFFKTKKVVTTIFEPSATFESSGTTGSVNSVHHVKDLELYRESFVRTFRQFYGNIMDWCIIALLPSYLERKNSSLVFMVNELIKLSGDGDSGFYLHDLEKLQSTLRVNEKKKKSTILIGVTYALLYFAEKYPMTLHNTTVVETGGMKGQREEITRQEVHQILKKQLGVNEVHSEYGMTELLSQAWSKKEGLFHSPAWMKILLRAEDDPFELLDENTADNARGAVNIVDLVNYYSCSFIATDDIGKLYPDGSFEILGRLDNSDTRGCGLMWI